MPLFRKDAINSKNLLKRVAQGEQPRLIDFRGDYVQAIPGTIPVQFDPDILYEEEQWVQDMLGVPFTMHQPVILICEFGHTAKDGVNYFKEKNPRSNFSVYYLKDGMYAYRNYIKHITRGFKKQSQFVQELTSMATSHKRFAFLIQGILKNSRRFSLFS
ncbi:rhodanese-like domain-containing protein [Magnetococcales bacterium HHB-1]